MSLVSEQFSFGGDVPFECYIYVVKKADGTEEFWFKGHDVADILDYEKPRDAINNNVYVAWRREWIDLQGANFGAPADGTNNVTTPNND
ncbi:BRO N-terminal domain [Cinara cedri]|uniref:BRO N-terminal domain n=1 Tax=Cinara cedri TaxID=506608 RepID=A0A5E4N2P3_9HEMI|nr:BRO N-terminal domain [Cinara cedri]